VNNIDLFPTRISWTKNLEFCQTLLPYATKYLQNKSLYSDIVEYPHTHGKEQEYKNEIPFVYEYFLEISKLYLRNLGYSDQNISCQIYFGLISRDQYHVKHNHPNCILSGVAYLDVGKNASPIIFYDPIRERQYYRPEIIKYSESNYEWYKITPESGLIIVWPAWLEHEVKLHEDFIPRTTCVFNIVKNY
jgi:hypothetical protein